MFLITLPDPYVLAIKLQSFTATRKGEDALLNWIVGTSSTAKSFEILKSRDAINFYHLSTVNAMVNATNYQQLDAKLDAGTTYYKLKITDEDGSISYSEIATVTKGSLAFELFSLAPNPVKDVTNVSIKAISRGTSVLNVVASNGAVILSQKISLEKGINNYKLNLSGLSAGVYYLYATDTQNKSNVVRIVKQ